MHSMSRSRSNSNISFDPSTPKMCWNVFLRLHQHNGRIDLNDDGRDIFVFRAAPLPLRSTIDVQFMSVCTTFALASVAYFGHRYTSKWKNHFYCLALHLSQPRMASVVYRQRQRRRRQRSTIAWIVLKWFLLSLLDIRYETIVAKILNRRWMHIHNSAKLHVRRRRPHAQAHTCRITDFPRE